MEIRRIYTNYMHNSEKCKNKPAKTTDDNSSSGKGSNNVDMIEISSDATFKSQLESAKKSCAQAVRTEVSPERINELKNKYQGNRCPVTGESVARSIVSRVLGSEDGE